MLATSPGPPCQFSSPVLASHPGARLLPGCWLSLTLATGWDGSIRVALFTDGGIEAQRPEGILIYQGAFLTLGAGYVSLPGPLTFDPYGSIQIITQERGN